jgi:hypothetical protein
MTKKAIKYPPVLSITLNGQTGTYGLGELCLFLIDSCKIFNETGIGIRSGARIDAEVRKNAELQANGTEVQELVLDAIDADKLASVCEEPDRGYPFTPSRVLIPFIDAILNAAEVLEDKKPEDKKDN